MKNLDSENYNTLLKEIRNYNKRHPWSCMGRQTIVKMMISLIVLQINASPIKASMAIFYRNWQVVLKIHMEQQTHNSQNNLKQKEQNWRTPTSQFQNVLQSYSNQDSVNWRVQK